MSVDVKIHIFDDEVLTIHDLEIFFSDFLMSKYFNPFMEISIEEENQIFEKIANTESICIEEVLDSFSPKTEEILSLINENLPIVDNALIGKLTQLDKDVGDRASKFYGKKLFWISW